MSYFIDMQTQQVDLLVTFGTIEWFLTILNSFMDISLSQSSLIVGLLPPSAASWSAVNVPRNMPINCGIQNMKKNVKSIDK